MYSYKCEKYNKYIIVDIVNRIIYVDTKQEETNKDKYKYNMKYNKYK